ncbi:hypothetical protein [Sphingomonas sp.]|uniref:hypothetical protein n=1 Tax=Sphingomonas sp. TaxID=28214 RepID=UPI003B00A3D0
MKPHDATPFDEEVERRMARIKRGWDADEGGWKTFVIIWIVIGFLAWAAFS